MLPGLFAVNGMVPGVALSSLTAVNPLPERSWRADGKAGMGWPLLVVEPLSPRQSVSEHQCGHSRKQDEMRAS